MEAFKKTFLCLYSILLYIIYVVIAKHGHGWVHISGIGVTLWGKITKIAFESVQNNFKCPN